MAKTCWLEREKRKAKTVAKYAALRAELKKKGDEEGHQIWERQRESVRAMLRPDQLPLFEQYQKEMDEQRKKRMQAEGKK